MMCHPARIVGVSAVNGGRFIDYASVVDRNEMDNFKIKFSVNEMTNYILNRNVVRRQIEIYLD